WDGMKEARESLSRINGWLERFREVVGEKSATIDNQLDHEFADALDDDLNISAALGFLFETIRETNRAMDENKLDGKTASGWLHWWDRINQTLRFESGEPRVYTLSGETGEFATKGTSANVKIEAGLAM